MRDKDFYHTDIRRKPKPADAIEVAQWLAEHGVECSIFSATIRREQCAINKAKGFARCASCANAGDINPLRKRSKRVRRRPDSPWSSNPEFTKERK